jgi:hypothetical protein
MDAAKVAQMVKVLNGLTARDALCLLVGCMLTVLDEAPSDKERQQSLDNCTRHGVTLALAVQSRGTGPIGRVRGAQRSAKPGF